MSTTNLEKPPTPVTYSEDYILKRKVYWDAQTKFRDYAFEIMRQEVTKVAPEARLIVMGLNDSNPPQLYARELLDEAGENLFGESDELVELESVLDAIAGDLELNDFSEVDTLLFRHEGGLGWEDLFELEIPAPAPKN